MKTRDVVYIAMYIALFAAFEWLSNVLPFKMPQGGSISLGAIPLLVASYHLGVKKSIMVTFLSLIVMFMMQPPIFLNITQFFFDYILAYGSYAFASLLPVTKGVILSSFARFMSHNIAGWAFFLEFYPENPLFGVIRYNAFYMIPTALISLICVKVAIPRLKQFF